MVFVHARNATGRIAKIMTEMAANRGEGDYFLPEDTSDTTLEIKNVMRI